MDSQAALPALRPIDVLPLRTEGELRFVLRDNAEISPHPLALSLAGYFVLMHLDGRHTVQNVQAAFAQQFGQYISADQVAEVVAALDENLLLENDRFHSAYDARLADFARATVRDNRHRWPSGTELRREIEHMLTGVNIAPTGGLCGVIAPHLDYARGAPCYAAAYALLRHALPADRFIILGTNHFGRSGGVVATRKDFQTPLGLAPTDRALIDRLEARVDGGLCADEFDHYAEHSVELQVHVLQVLQDAPFEIVPVLCPDPSASAVMQRPPAGAGLDAFVAALAEEIQSDGRRTVLIAGADLSHVGQRFGDPDPTTTEWLSTVERNDRALLDLLVARQEETFVSTVRAAGNSTRICSVGCMYALLRALPDASCRLLRYHQAVDLGAETHVTCAALALEAAN